MHIMRASGCLSVIAALALTLSSCGASVGGTPTPGEIDVRKLDVGSYSTDPIDMQYRYIPQLYFGKQLAAMRLLDKIAIGTEIEPKLTSNSAGAIVEPKDGLNKDMSDGLVTALERNGMLYGVMTEKRQQKENEVFDADELVDISVYQFPDKQSADAAAKAFEDADFAIAGDQNQSVQLDKYPTARSHWRPGIRTIGSRMAEGNYLLDVFARAPQPELPQLTSFIEHIYDVQIPLLRDFPPLSKRDILHLPYDPNGMYRKTLAAKGFYGPSLLTSGSFTTRGFLNVSNSDGKILADKGKIEAVSTTEGSTTLFRSADAASAQALAEELRRRVRSSIDPPQGVPDAFCEENTEQQVFTDNRFRCVVRYGRYAARVASSQIKDAQQRAAAQYAVLATSW
ncbi:hypothetical protein [Nocardia sp. NRRL WC-3656]|uniref:DUF7373 family lipoprotein n=1 Tax=Nocardia sp. NRRL WC-3656 TaxID=1463824 RepID=UPI0012DE4664|nr:hypothetical protein [Nocardia sp. NRRL WC-3656]